MKKIHILESTLRYLLDEGRNAEKAKQKTIAVMKNYLSQNGVQGEQLETMAAEYEHSLKEWLFHANMPDSIIRLEPIMANVAMQLGFTPKDRDTEELYRLKDITNYIIANYKNTDFPIALNKLTLDNTSFDSLNELFGSAIDSSKGSWKSSNDDKPKPHYTVKRLDTFEEANEYYPYTQDICYLRGEETWNDYTSNGKNAVYVLLRDGWEDIPAEHGEDTPYDDYGESMVFVIIRPDSKVAYTNTRWNHNTNGQGPIDVDQSFTEDMDKISDMLQTDYRNVLKPYTDEELLGRGVIKLSVLRRWISEGKDILQICKNVEELSTNLFKIDLDEDNFILYNSQINKLIPSDDIIFLYMIYHIKYVIVQQENGKWAFINKQGQQIGDWYRNVWPFDEGLTCVQRDDGKWTIINTDGQQICDWYEQIHKYIHNWLIAERDDGKYALLNSKNFEVISDWFRYIHIISDKVVKIQRDDGKYAMLNKQGQIISDWYIRCSQIKNISIAVQRDDGKWTIINTDGQQICDWYEGMTINLDEEPIIVERKDGNMAYMNAQGQIISDWYKKIQMSGISGISQVWKEDGKTSLINRYGKIITDWFTHDTIFYVYGSNKIHASNNREDYIKIQTESYLRLNNLITEALHKSIRKYLLYN